jgi:hypothetical protein
MVPLPPVPRWVPHVAIAVWLIVVVLSAVVAGDNGFAARLAGLVLGTVAPVAFAVAGGALVVQRWQRREWERRTRFIVGMLIDESLDVLTGFAVATYGVLVGALPEQQRRGVLPLDSAFRLPLTEEQIGRMHVSSVITKGVISALGVASQEASKRARQARETHAESFKAYVDASLKDYRNSRRKAAEILGEQLPDDQAHQDVTRPDTDDLIPEAGSTADERTATSDAPRNELPEDSMPFGIEPDVTLQTEVIRRRWAVASEFDLAVTRLYGLLVELSVYVSAQATRLVETAVQLRGEIRQNPAAKIPRTPSPSHIKAAGDRPRFEQNAAEIVADAASKALEEADDAASNANQALSVSLQVFAILRVTFDLLGTLDEVYRLRYRDPSRGIERVSIAFREASNRNLDNMDAVITGARQVNSAMADFLATWQARSTDE